MQSHQNGSFLQKPNKVILKEREKDRLKRLNELKELEKALKKKVQVKFLVNLPELEDIKRGALNSQQTQSEFIRSAIRDKIRIINAQSKTESLPEDKLCLEELKRIRILLERLEKKDK